MRRKGSDLVGRWPWGMWLALVGVSAGTVASFALVGWAFMALSGEADVDAADQSGWDAGEVVIEGESESDSGEPSQSQGPTMDARPAPETEAAPIEPETDAESESGEPELEPTPEASGSASDPRLVRIEESADGRPEESGGDGTCSNESSEPELVLERLSETWARSKE